MPKQRNHQHHRRHGGAQTGFQQPLVGWFSAWYPDSWIRRPFPTRQLGFIYVRVAVVSAALVFGLALLLALLSGH